MKGGHPFQEEQTKFQKGSHPLQKVATFFDIELELQILQDAKRRLLADQKAWEHKNRIGRGKVATNNRHIDAIQKQINYLDKKLGLT